ncbi:2,3-bisphosphoglycerate-independent phosphoglycerate mutase [Candidatus Bipolaricaulota bacterium]|nr:2,3-bisphosphoglycerate-independent phosphoglycerate mutase [Candidatus Bipolaricaulota bacterium]
MKTIMIVTDGLGGRPTDIDGKTCLQVAETPEIDDLLARRGTGGLMDPIANGVRPGSDTAHLSLFGYDPYEYYTGRGVFEAAGIGMDLTENDVCFRTNFATIDSNGNIADRRAGRISESQDELEEALADLESEKFPEVEVRFKRSTQHRGALCLRGPELGGNVSPTDPHELGIPIPESSGQDEKSKKTASILNEVTQQARKILDKHPVNEQREKEGKLPANAILSRGSAKYPELPSVEEKYGVTSSVIAAGALYIGVARVAGMAFKQVEGATGTVDSNILNKAKKSVDELEKGKDMVFLHFKGADNASHDQDAEAKTKYIEKVDDTIGWLKKNTDWESTHLSFAGDHSSPIQYGDHVADPVPVMITGPNVRRDELKTFDEYSCMKGGLGRFSGNLLPMTLSYSNQLPKFGA